MTLGRPSKEKVKERKRIEKQDAVERIEIEGKFGEQTPLWHGSYFDMPSTDK